MTIANNPPRGLRAVPPGPNSTPGVSAEISTNPEEIKNQPPTNPPWMPTQPHKDPLSQCLLIPKTNPKRNNPTSKPINPKNPRFTLICERLKIAALTTNPERGPNNLDISINSHPRKRISSANPTAMTRKKELSKILTFKWPIHFPEGVSRRGVKTRDNNPKERKSPLTKYLND